jgi:NADH dehydrogenase FAD-containing subunit
MKFCGVPSRVFDKLVCASGEERWRHTALETQYNAHQQKSAAQRRNILSKIRSTVQNITP